MGCGHAWGLELVMCCMHVHSSCCILQCPWYGLDGLHATVQVWTARALFKQFTNSCPTQVHDLPPGLRFEGAADALQARLGPLLARQLAAEAAQAPGCQHTTPSTNTITSSISTNPPAPLELSLSNVVPISAPGSSSQGSELVPTQQGSNSQVSHASTSSSDSLPPGSASSEGCLLIVSGVQPAPTSSLPAPCPTAGSPAPATPSGGAAGHRVHGVRIVSQAYVPGCVMGVVGLSLQDREGEGVAMRPQQQRMLADVLRHVVAEVLGVVLPAVMVVVCSTGSGNDGDATANDEAGSERGRRTGTEQWVPEGQDPPPSPGDPPTPTPPQELLQSPRQPSPQDDPLCPCSLLPTTACLELQAAAATQRLQLLLVCPGCLSQHATAGSTPGLQLRAVVVQGGAVLCDHAMAVQPPPPGGSVTLDLDLHTQQQQQQQQGRRMIAPGVIKAVVSALLCCAMLCYLTVAVGSSGEMSAVLCHAVCCDEMCHAALAVCTFSKATHQEVRTPCTPLPRPRCLLVRCPVQPLSLWRLHPPLPASWLNAPCLSCLLAAVRPRSCAACGAGCWRR